jgi:small subunit ribosomal protein S16
MLKIRLLRTGKRGQPHYRIVVAERRSKRDGKYSDSLGYYQPKSNPALLKLDVDKYESWLKKGAQPTPTVSYLRSKTETSQPIEIKKLDKNKNFKTKIEAKKTG